MKIIITTKTKTKKTKITKTYKIIIKILQITKKNLKLIIIINLQTWILNKNNYNC